MVGIIDYGVGNLFSLRSSLAAIGQEVLVSSEPEVLQKADHILLPGVGAFEDAVQKLRSSGLDQMVYESVKASKPLMGICLGMQMLFEKSFEYGEHQGLGLLQGQVIPMAGLLPENLKIPTWAGTLWISPSPMASSLPIQNKGIMSTLSTPILLQVVRIPWQPGRNTVSGSPLRWKRIMSLAASSIRRRAAKWDLIFCARSARCRRFGYEIISCH